jgi:hypothetical protein
MAVIEQVPVPLEIVSAPVMDPTEHAVEAPAEQLYAPVPLPPAADTLRPIWPYDAEAGAATVTGACEACVIVKFAVLYVML